MMVIRLSKLISVVTIVLFSNNSIHVHIYYNLSHIIDYGYNDNQFLSLKPILKYNLLFIYMTKYNATHIYIYIIHQIFQQSSYLKDQ